MVRASNLRHKVRTFATYLRFSDQTLDNSSIILTAFALPLHTAPSMLAAIVLWLPSVDAQIVQSEIRTEVTEQRLQGVFLPFLGNIFLFSLIVSSVRRR